MGHRSPGPIEVAAQQSAPVLCNSRYGKCRDPGLPIKLKVVGCRATLRPAADCQMNRKVIVSALECLQCEIHVNAIERFVGTYEGAGEWHDSAGQSLGYRVRQTSLPTANGFELVFKHDFDDGTVTDARFNMTVGRATHLPCRCVRHAGRARIHLRRLLPLSPQGRRRVRRGQLSFQRRCRRSLRIEHEERRRQLHRMERKLSGERLPDAGAEQPCGSRK